MAAWLPLALMALLGLFCLLFARAILAFFLRGMDWQKRHIGGGGTVPLQIRILQSRGALWFVRIFSALILLGGAIAGLEALKGARP
jgi:hypothetical protein